MKIYISGKITGCDNWRENFDAMEWYFKNKDTIIYNPVKLSYEVECKKPIPTYGDYMRHDIAKLLECDKMILLPNWETSKGARAEATVAEACGIPIERISEADFHSIIIDYRQRKTQKKQTVEKDKEMTTKEAREKLYEMWKQELHRKGTPQFCKEKYEIYNKIIRCVDEFFEIKEIAARIKQKYFDKNS